MSDIPSSCVARKMAQKQQHSYALICLIITWQKLEYKEIAMTHAWSTVLFDSGWVLIKIRRHISGSGTKSEKGIHTNAREYITIS